MKHLIATVLALSLGAPAGGLADHKDLALFVNPGIAESGLMGFLLPRFSLKTGITVHAEPLTTGAAIPPHALTLQEGPGRLVLSGLGQKYAISDPDPDNPAAVRLFDWLLTDIGQRTISHYSPDGAQIFTGAAGSGPVAQVAMLVGNVRRGEMLSYDNCGRCHVISKKNRMKGIGSTPSFALLRSLEDWQDRFQAFYSLNPHPSFTQISGVTEPFDKTLPPPISPLFLTLADLDDIVAFTDSIEPVDLGAPLVHQ